MGVIMKKYIVFFTILLCAMQSISAAAPQSDQWGHITDADFAALDQDPETLALAIQNSINVQKERQAAYEASFRVRQAEQKKQQAANIALHTAIRNQKIKEIEQALANGADVNGVDHRGQTPLLCAIDKYYNLNFQSNPRKDNALNIIKLLIKEKADINTIDKSIYPIPNDNVGSTALIQAIKNTTAPRLAFQIVELLLDNNADANAVDNEGNTPLMWATISLWHPNDIQLLLDHNANVNAINHQGDTALMLAATQSHSRAAKLVLDTNNYTSPFIRNTMGETACSIAKKKRIAYMEHPHPGPPIISEGLKRCDVIVAMLKKHQAKKMAAFVFAYKQSRNTATFDSDAARPAQLGDLPPEIIQEIVRCAQESDLGPKPDSGDSAQEGKRRAQEQPESADSSSSSSAPASKKQRTDSSLQG